MNSPILFLLYGISGQRGYLIYYSAVHKPADISSAEVLRNLQTQFNPSKFFQPWIDTERARRVRESRNQNRRRRNKRVEVKLGHGGTLDPIATGVLIAGVGKGTKSLNSFLGCTKTYETVVLFGVGTDTYDRVGKVVSRAPYEHVTREVVEKALQGFRGKIMQRPSIFSALKVQGKKLYEYAREGIEPPVEILKRPVEVSNLEILEWYDGGSHDYTWPTEEASGTERQIAQKMLSKESHTSTASEQKEEGESGDKTQGQKRKTPPSTEKETDDNTTRQNHTDDQPDTKRPKNTPDPSLSEKQVDQQLESTSPAPAPTQPSNQPHPPAVKLTMTVSSGFYVRSLAQDLGLAVGSNAIMSSLVRTRQGDFELAPEKILEYKDLDGGEEVWGPKLQKFLDDWNKKTQNSNDSGGEAESEKGAEKEEENGNTET